MTNQMPPTGGERAVVPANARTMRFTGPGTGLWGTVSTERQGALSKIAGSFVVDTFEVSLFPEGDETLIEVVSRTTGAWTDDLETQLQAAVKPYVLALCWRTGAALDLKWTGSNVVAADGRREVAAWGSFRVVKARDPIQALGAYASDAELVQAHPELAAAIEEYSGSTRLVDDHPGAAMALAYLAVEGLVTHALGSTSGSLTSSKDWSNAAPKLGSPPDVLLHLLWSTQLGRHVDPVRAKARLAQAGWTALSAHQCSEVALDILQAYGAVL